ncbi:P-loop NTPase [Streptomyces sp. bgisy091]|uniref:P-loop NTPase n=1 Tax=Streptomyces sp. bgisy091 TaxID=3413778 RepID=UPI003D72E5FD
MTAEAGLLPAARVLLVCGGKGGVGKSTVAANLAVTLAAGGLRVGLLDTDLQGPSLPVMFGLDERPAVRAGLIVPPERHGVRLMSTGLLAARHHALAWRGPLLRGALKQMLRDVAWEDPDVLVVDTPPGTGEVHMGLHGLLGIWGAVMVTTSQRVALEDTRRCATMLRTLGIPVRAAVDNMAHHRCPECGSENRIFSRNLPKEAAEACGVDPERVTSIPIQPEIAESGDDGTPVVLTALGEALGVSELYRRLASPLAPAAAAL